MKKEKLLQEILTFYFGRVFFCAAGCGSAAEEKTQAGSAGSFLRAAFSGTVSGSTGDSSRERNGGGTGSGGGCGDSVSADCHG